MQFEVIPTPKFQEDIKYYLKKRLFKHITEDVNLVIFEIKNGNLVGDEIPDLRLPQNENVFKVRMANTDTKQGKSNGYRILYYAVKNNIKVYLLTIYYKKEDKKVVSKQEIIRLIEEYCK